MKSRLFLQLLCLVAAISCQNYESDDVDLTEASGDSTPSFPSTEGGFPPTTPEAVPGGSTEAVSTGGSTSQNPGDTVGTGSTLPPGSTTLFTGSTITGETQQPITAGTGTTEEPGSTATAAPTTPKPPPTIPMESFTMPNSLNPLDAKVVYQEALALANHIQDLLNEIATLQNETSPDSPLITELDVMTANATGMITTLDGLTTQLNATNANLTVAIDNYNNVSRIFNCIATNLGVVYTTPGPTTMGTTTIPTTTTPGPYTCDKNLTATGTEQTVTFYGNGTKCSYTVSAAAGSGTVKYTLVLAVTDPGYVTVIDVISGATLANYTDSDTTNAQTNTTVLRFDAYNPTSVQYNLTYSAFDPCKDYGCQPNCSECKLNSLGQPFCKLNSSNPCVSLGPDGKSCPEAVNPCIFRGNQKCTDPTPVCVMSNETCSATCHGSPSPPHRFLGLYNQKEEDIGLRGFLHRWVF